MVVYLNNKQFQFSKQKSISEIVLQDLNLSDPKGMAIAVNQEVVPRANWENFLVKENDKLTIIKATQGG